MGVMAGDAGINVFATAEVIAPAPVTYKTTIEPLAARDSRGIHCVIGGRDIIVEECGLTLSRGGNRVNARIGRLDPNREGKRRWLGAICQYHASRGTHHGVGYDRSDLRGAGIDQGRRDSANGH